TEIYTLSLHDALPIFGICLFLAVLSMACGTADGDRIVTCGADRLFPEYFHLIEGKRVALVANHSGVLADGTHLADALHQHPGVRSEEHTSELQSRENL